EYLKGRHAAEATSPQAIELSLLHFRRALELDPDFAPAWAGLSHCHWVRAGRGMAPPAVAIQEAREAALRALELDPGLAEAHEDLGAIHFWERDFRGAAAELEKAVELNPGSREAHVVLGRIQFCSGLHEAAQASMLAALSIDPLSMIVHTTVG